MKLHRFNECQKNPVIEPGINWILEMDNNVPLSPDAPHAFCDNTPLHLKSVQTFSLPLSQAAHHVINNLQVKHKD